MIENDQQLETNHQALEAAYQSLATLRRGLRPVHTQAYESSARPLLRQIAELRAEIDAYLDLDQAEPLDEPVPYIIENDEQLRGTHQALGNLCRALASLRKDLPPASRNYALYAQGNIDEILKLQAEIDCYLGRVWLLFGNDKTPEKSGDFEQPR
jgi:hypothetical protein